MIENCPMRHENGNCIPAGGFCTANKNICEALLNAYGMGKTQLSKECTTKGTTSDPISRQEAIDALDCINGTEEVLRSLPPAQPERAEGEWVQIQRCARDAQPDLECPFCKHRIGWWDMGRYCARCGAKLKGSAG